VELAKHRASVPPEIPEVQCHGAKQGRVLLVAPAPPPYGGMALQAEKLDKLLRGEGVAISWLASNFPLPAALKPLERIPGIRTVLRALLIWPKLWTRADAVDVVHILAASWAYFFLVVCPAVVTGRLKGKRVVLNYRGGEAGRFFRLFGWAAAPAFRWADSITAPSEFLAKVIRERFDVSVSIVPNILDTRIFRFRLRPSIQPKLLVSRHLEKPYDIESVLRAFAQVQEHYPQSSLWIAGTGSEQQRLRRLSADWNLRNVRFLGHVAHQDLPAVYDQCDIYLNASRVDNFPGALLEASAAGLVMVSTAAGGIPFIYEHEKTALLVEPGNWQELAAAVRKVLQNPSLALKMTTAGALLAHACDWREVREPLYQAYGFPAKPGWNTTPGEDLTAIGKGVVGCE